MVKMSVQYNNISPLRYPGGKSRACKVIDKIIQEHFNLNNYDTLLSPFFGGGSFEFYFQNNYNVKLIVNDKFTPLYNFWKQIKADKHILCSELKKITDVTKDDFIRYRNSILSLNNDQLKQALYYFIINRCSFSGATLSGGFSKEASLKRYTQSSIDRIEALNLSNTIIHNLDFEQFINENFNEKILMFLDPPYYLDKKSKLYGTNGDLHEHFNHEKLFNVISNKKNWILTYNNCQYIRDMYKDYLIINVEWTYSMNKNKESSEIIIISK